MLRLLQSLLRFPRHLRLLTPAKLLLGFILFALYIAVQSTHHPHSILESQEEQSRLSALRPEELSVQYEDARLRLLDSFDPIRAASLVKSPAQLPSGGNTFDISVATYCNRLRNFVDSHFSTSPVRDQLLASIETVERRAPPRADGLPKNVYSTSPDGSATEAFELWSKLLPIPLAPNLVRLLHDDPGADPWNVVVASDDDVDRLMSEWTGETVTRGVVSPNPWGRLWGLLSFGVLRADIFRYAAMLCSGSIYADSDTAPIAHPYLWGIDAQSILPPDLAAIMPHLDTYHPPYVRRPPPSITHPDISLVIAVEWDSTIAYDWWRLFMWTPLRWRRARDDVYARRLEFVQYLSMAKPYHPVFLDVLATISENLELGHMQDLGAIELTGPGPFTDAVLRYLLVQYGVTPDSLRDLRGPVRIGDVLILQEESLLAPHSAIRRLLSHVSRMRGDPWIFGEGYRSWRSGGTRVAFHGLAGTWKNKGW